MTHPTDEKLDALDAKLASQIGDDVAVIFDHEYLFKQSRDAITALRAQLAEVQADLTFMTEDRNKWQDSATDRYFRIEESNARADRAEEEVRRLKAAIFGSENYAPDLKCGNFVEMAETLHAAQKGGLERADRAEAALAALEAAPHANETPKSEHDRADVLTATTAPVALAESLEVPEVRALVEALDCGINQYREMMEVNSAFYDAARAALSAIGECEA